MRSLFRKQVRGLSVRWGFESLTFRFGAGSCWHGWLTVDQLKRVRFPSAPLQVKCQWSHVTLPTWKDEFDPRYLHWKGSCKVRKVVANH